MIFFMIIMIIFNLVLVMFMGVYENCFLRLFVYGIGVNVVLVFIGGVYVV